MNTPPMADPVTAQATNMTTKLMIPTVIDALVAKHGGLRAAARAIQINYAYLSRLRSGEKTNPTAATLRKLGLKKVVTYAPLKPMRTFLEFQGESLEFK